MKWIGTLTRAAITIIPMAVGACVAATPPTESPRRFVPAKLQPGDGRSIISNSTLDVENQYLSTVLIMTPGRGSCSGVVIAPRLVVTAGHCVCSPRKAVPPESPAYTVIDKTTCAQQTTLFVIRYREEDSALAQKRHLTGRVEPNAQLRILYNAEEKEVLSTADLAVIFLDDALDNIKPVRLSAKPLQTQEAVVLVGYGQEDPTRKSSWNRHIGANEIATIEKNGATFLVGKPITVRNPYVAKEPLLVREEASYSFAGDSGGPCLRERKGTVELVGIAKTAYGEDHLVEFSEYTSTYAFKDWLGEEIKKSRQTDSD